MTVCQLQHHGSRLAQCRGLQNARGGNEQGTVGYLQMNRALQPLQGCLEILEVPGKREGEGERGEKRVDEHEHTGVSREGRAG